MDVPKDLHRVLYVEDDAVSAALVREIFDTLFPSLELVHAATGAEGVRLVREAHPDLVLLDMHLPDMSGLDVLRQLTLIAGAPRVVLLTADKISPDVVKALALGAYEYWTKPINLTQFQEGVKRALAGGPARLPQHLASAIASPSVPSSPGSHWVR